MAADLPRRRHQPQFDDHSVHRDVAEAARQLATGADRVPEPEPEHAAEGKKHFPAWHRLALVGITLISVFMNFYQLGQNGFVAVKQIAVTA